MIHRRSFITGMASLIIAWTIGALIGYKVRPEQRVFPFAALCPNSTPMATPPRVGADGTISMVMWCSDPADLGVVLQGDPASPFKFSDHTPEGQPSIYMRDNR